MVRSAGPPTDPGFSQLRLKLGSRRSPGPPHPAQRSVRHSACGCARARRARTRWRCEPRHDSHASRAPPAHVKRRRFLANGGEGPIATTGGRVLSGVERALREPARPAGNSSARARARRGGQEAGRRESGVRVIRSRRDRSWLWFFEVRLDPVPVGNDEVASCVPHKNRRAMHVAGGRLDVAVLDSRPGVSAPAPAGRRGSR